MDNTAQLHMQTMRHFNERQRRMYAGSLARQYGWGGITRVHKETGLDPHTIMRGMRELEEEPLLDRVRKVGGGRKKTEQHQPRIIDAIELEANPKTDKRTIVKWTSHSLAHIARKVKTARLSDCKNSGPTNPQGQRICPQSEQKRRGRRKSSS